CSPEALAKVDQITPCRYGAPVVLIVAYDKNNVFTYPGERVDSGREDATIVATHMILAATDEGLNSLWINRIDPDEVIKVFGLPENEDVLMVMDIGYGDENYGPSTNHENRKDLSETVTYL
ncbi:MAG: nitroreductase family protein, partial [Erysipelotrichaceae bacterium]|nr:nitroreductase family protein [Erysipelotrichaceae bacterium]